MHKKIDISTHGRHLIQVAIERDDEASPWRLSVLIRALADSAWSAPWRDVERGYYTCFDALAAGRKQGAKMIDEGAPPADT